MLVGSILFEQETFASNYGILPLKVKKNGESFFKCQGFFISHLGSENQLNKVTTVKYHN
jgi:hypothetical protein